MGEPSTASNAFIPNDISYWDDKWMKHFGGVDDPETRCDFHPCTFAPLENPFYFALPYGEFNMETGTLKDSARQVPWFSENAPEPLLKNRWIEVKYSDNICYGQWEDVGPNGEDDFVYVFGDAISPINTFGAHAGLDVSPSLWDCLGLSDNDVTSWRFVDSSSVPSGPWKDTVTSSGITWGTE